jgi:hypothetical protein
MRTFSLVLIASLLSICIVRPVHALSPITIGDTQIESAVDSGNGNLALAQEAALPQSATIVSLSFFVKRASGNLILGLYDATGPRGGPGKLLAVTGSFATANGWNTANVAAPVTLAAGNYWLAYLPSSSSLTFQKQNDSGNCVYRSQSFSQGLPATFGSSTANCSPTTWSFYATLTPSGTSNSSSGGRRSGGGGSGGGGSGGSGSGGTPVNGLCGSSNGLAASATPTANLCLTGTASAVAGNGPWNWMCAGSNGGTTSSCQAPLASPSPVNGICGSANGVAVSTAPTANLCSTGTASAVAGNGPWNWMCTGANGGTTGACQAPLASGSGGSGGSGGTPGSPIVFQHIGSSTNPVGVGVSGSTFVLQIEPLPANTVAVMEVTVPHGTSVSISDTLAGTWSGAVCTADAGSGNYAASVFVQPLGASGGAETITIHASNAQPVQAEYTFFQNVNTTSPVSGHLCTASLSANSSGLINPGSFTPTNNDANGGNVIWNATTLADAANSNTSSWAPASGFTLLDGDIAWITDQGFPKAAQYEVQSTAASVTPSITGTGENPNGDLFNSVSVALAAADNGAAAPSAIHVERIIHETVNLLNSPGTLKVMFPASGNLRVIGMDWNDGCPQPSGAGCLSSITSSDGCAWTLKMDNPGAAVVAYAQNCAPCPTCTATLKFSGSQTVPGFSFRLYDIQNAASSSFRNSAGNVGSCGTTLSNAPSITPTGASSGLTIAEMGDTEGVVTGLTSPTQAVFDLWTFNGENGVDMSENADFSGHLYYSSPVQQNWNFTKTASSDTCYWEAAIFN